jgi:phage terminase small subunit
MRLKPKQKKFAEKYLEIGVAGKAAEEVYDVKNNATARSIGSENLTKPNIIEYLEGKQPKYINKMEFLSEGAKNEGVQFQATKDLLDRSGLKPIEKSEVKTTSLTFDVKIKPRTAKLIDKFEKEIYEKL